MRGFLIAMLALSACHEPAPQTAPPSSSDDTAADEGGPDGGAPESPDRADVVGVGTRGDAGSYTFAVSVRSPDRGCDRYADWWEVLDSDGALLYRRILGHSHVDEQPFERSGGPVPIDADTTVFVRAHLNPGGYGGQLMTGTVVGGFETVTSAPTFAPEIEQAAPQPDGCAF